MPSAEAIAAIRKVAQSYAEIAVVRNHCFLVFESVRFEIPSGDDLGSQSVLRHNVMPVRASPAGHPHPVASSLTNIEHAAIANAHVYVGIKTSDHSCVNALSDCCTVLVLMFGANSGAGAGELRLVALWDSER